MSGKIKQRRQERVNLVAADPDNLDNTSSKEAVREVQGPPGLSTNC